MSLDRSRSPPRYKRFRSSERVSFRDAPYQRDRRAYRCLMCGMIWKEACRSLAYTIWENMRGNIRIIRCFCGYDLKNCSVELPNADNTYCQLSFSMLGFKRPCLCKQDWQDNLCNNCKRPGHFGRDCPNVTVCNNCGLPGHFASECTSTTMCWNCKEPGHLASECNNDPVCHVCGNMGHRARDCTNSSLPSHDARLCNNCYKAGHIAADCTNDKACNNCRKTGHLARDCPNDPVCNICNISGHVARQCRKSHLPPIEMADGPFRDMICRNCGLPGHISRDCVSIVICNNCGGRGHHGYQCPSVPMLHRGLRRF